MQRVLRLFLLLTCPGPNWTESVINGDKVPDGAMLYMVSVQNNYGHVCGGFLVSDDFVLTAAQCSHDFPTKVILGNHNLRNHFDGQSIEIMTPPIEPEDTGDDLMLLKLSEKAVLGNRVQIIKLPDANMKVKESECQVAGWGNTDGNNVKELMFINVSIKDTTTCKKAWPCLPDNVICAGGKRVFCQRDSGGPLVCGGDTAVGVVSFNETCKKANEAPNDYVNISKYLPWIFKVISNN